jgi:hypothetical protein
VIYFVQPTDGGAIKIGYCASYLKGRLHSLEVHYGCRLVLLGTMEGGLEREAEIHGRFAHLRLGTTEQFRPALELMEFIGLPILGTRTDAVRAAIRATLEQLSNAG